MKYAEQAKIAIFSKEDWSTILICKVTYTDTQDRKQINGVHIVDVQW